MPGLIGKKIGMTRIFSEEGFQIPVTVIEAGPCPVVQVKSEDGDGYQAIQLGFGSKKAKRASQAEIGHSATAGLEAAPRLLREFSIEDGAEYEVGQELTVEQFEAGDRVKVTGRSKGRGSKVSLRGTDLPCGRHHTDTRCLVSPVRWVPGQIHPGLLRAKSSRGVWVEPARR